MRGGIGKPYMLFRAVDSEIDPRRDRHTGLLQQRD